MSTGQTILVVEDETKLASLLIDYLAAAGFATGHVADGREVAPWVRERAPDLVLLDLMLPGRDGLEVCRELRAFTATPIIMVTARIEEIDRLLGLELGADDYICKPFSPREVVARVKAVLRRGAPAPAIASRTLALERSALRVRVGETEIELTAVEFALLDALHGAPGRIYTRDELMDRIYDDHRVVSDRTIDSHVKKLRKKLAALAPGRELVHSVYGVGYRFEDRSD